MRTKRVGLQECLRHHVAFHDGRFWVAIPETHYGTEQGTLVGRANFIALKKLLGKGHVKALCSSDWEVGTEVVIFRQGGLEAKPLKLPPKIIGVEVYGYPEGNQMWVALDWPNLWEVIQKLELEGLLDSNLYNRMDHILEAKGLRVAIRALTSTGRWSMWKKREAELEEMFWECISQGKLTPAWRTPFEVVFRKQDLEALLQDYLEGQQEYLNAPEGAE